MRKSRFSEEQIIQAIKQMDAGLSAADVGRELGVNQYTLYRCVSFPITHTLYN